MIEKRKKALLKELKYLTSDVQTKEIELNKKALENENVKIKDLAQEIYVKRGIDIKKIQGGFLLALTDEITTFSGLFYNKDKKVRNKMIWELLYIVILLVLIKIPFDLVRDIGLDYIEIITTKELYYNLWSLLFLILYTITIICSFLVLIRNFNQKYNQ